MKKSFMILAALLCFMIFFTSIGGTYATWFFAEEPSDSVNNTASLTLSEFTWEPEEILPTVTPGQNYLTLHTSILDNGKNGLNSSKDALEKTIIKERLLHNTHNIQGGNLKHLFIDAECRELNFIIQYVSDTEFHLYMYKEDDVKTGAVGTTEIQVYKSILNKKNNKWIGSEAQFGYAKIQYLPDTNIIAIDINSWYR